MTVIENIKGLEGDELNSLLRLLQDKEKTRDVLRSIQNDNVTETVQYSLRKMTTWEQTEMADRITDLEEQLAESKNLLKKAI